MKKFFDDDCKARAGDAVRRIEAGSAAEVVVMVEKRSNAYRHTHYLFGLAAALAVLAVFLYAPDGIDFTTWPLDLAAVFAVAAALCESAPWLTRRLTRAATMREQVARAARAAFVDRGIGVTRGRTGVLVYVSALEGLVEVVADVGLAAATENEAWKAAVAGMDRSVGAGDAAGFLAALDALAEPLAKAVPRQADDVNELSDEVAA